MDQYEIMRLLFRVAEVLFDVAENLPGASERAGVLCDDIKRIAAQWNAEEHDELEALTRGAVD